MFQVSGISGFRIRVRVRARVIVAHYGATGPTFACFFFITDCVYTTAKVICRVIISQSITATVALAPSLNRFRHPQFFLSACEHCFIFRTSPFRSLRVRCFSSYVVTSWHLGVSSNRNVTYVFDRERSELVGAFVRQAKRRQLLSR